MSELHRDTEDVIAGLDVQPARLVRRGLYTVAEIVSEARLHLEALLRERNEKAAEVERLQELDTRVVIVERERDEWRRVVMRDLLSYRAGDNWRVDDVIELLGGEEVVSAAERAALEGER